MSAACYERFCAVAAQRGEQPALLFGAECVSFQALVRDAERFSERLAVAPGSRIIVRAPNTPQLASAVAGIWRCGAVPVWVHADAPASHLEHAVRQTAAAAIVGTEACAGLPAFGPQEALARAEAAPRPLPAQSAHAPASIVFTSGSTGMPKGVVQSAANLIDGADRVARYLGYRSADRLLCPVPFAFDYGWGQLLSTLLGGHTLVLPAARNAFGLCEAIERHRPTVLAAVPAALADLFSGLAPIDRIDSSSIRLVTNTGSKIPRPVFEALLGRFAHAAVALNYGLTETYRSASLPPALARSHPDSVGRAIPGVDLAVLREDGTPAAAGEEGEIVHRGAGTFLGYWGDAQRSAQVLRPDPLWPHAGLPAPKVVFTGDLGWKDGAGLLYVRGRRDRQLKSMGVRVSPDEVEALLLASGLVREAAVVARPHDTLGDMGVAVLAPSDPAPLRQLTAHARATMSPHMQPRDWLLVERLPRTPSGKVDYPALAQLAAQPA